MGSPWEGGTSQIWIGSIGHGGPLSTIDANAVTEIAVSNPGWFSVSEDGVLTSAA